MAGNANVPRIEAYVGQTGSGKGVSIRRRLAELRPSRLLVYDPRDEWAELAPSRPINDLARGFLASAGGPYRARFVPIGRASLKAEFALLCQVAFKAGDLVFLCDELADVTTPSWAPPEWKRCTNQGRHRALHILGAAQRPAQIDKSFLGNCNLVRVGSLGWPDDEAAMAKALKCSPDLVAGLQMREQPGGGVRLQMLERDKRAGVFDLVELRVDRRGKTTETRVPVASGPLRGGAGHVNAKSLSSPRRGAKTERATP